MASNIEIQDEDDDEGDDDVNYANVQTKTTARLKHPRKKHPRKTRSVRRRYCLVVLGFGLLCGVQALLNIGLRLSLYPECPEEKNNLTKVLVQLQSRYNNVTAERDELKRTLCESNGWQMIGSGCYHISTTGWKTWEESRQFCRDKRSGLIIINSKEKQDFVKNYRNVWLGLTDREEEGVWKWIDGTTLTTPTYWGPGEPDNAGEQDCAVSYNGVWYDRQCSYGSSQWICERVI